MSDDRTHRLNISIRHSGGSPPKFPNITRPNPIGLYSVNQERQFINSAENLRYFVMPKKMPLNLNDGYEVAIKKDEDRPPEYLNSMLNFIRNNKHNLVDALELNNKVCLLPADIVCYRGVLRLIMETPYECRKDWRLFVSKLNGTIYMSQVDTPQDIADRQNQTEMMKRMCSWGFKFEQFCSTIDPKVPPETSGPVDECSELNCVYTSNFGGIRVLYGAEMDGIESTEAIDISKPIDLTSLRFVELKTRQKTLNEAQKRTFLRHKSRKWWCQTYLVAIENIYVGMRNEAGLTFSIDRMSVASLAKNARNWSASVCADFLERFLLEVCKVMSDIKDPKTVLQFDYISHQAQITYKVFDEGNSPAFIPMWFIKEFGNA